MPKVTGFYRWDGFKWDNLDMYSGTKLEGRPYYYKIIPSPGGNDLLIISAPDRKQPLHAVDFLCLNRRTLTQLNKIADTEGV